ncbi:hypothetical protein [Glycomyces sambucus]|nr:hypothetical protein [Glycomyces sambucus]
MIHRNGYEAHVRTTAKNAVAAVEAFGTDAALWIERYEKDGDSIRLVEDKFFDFSQVMRIEISGIDN